MIGILVHGDNHFIVDGPAMPDDQTALALIRHWSVIQIGAVTPRELTGWTIVNRAFRENLEWAVVVEATDDISAAVATLLEEMAARAIAIHHISS